VAFLLWKKDGLYVATPSEKEGSEDRGWGGPKKKAREANYLKKDRQVLDHSFATTRGGMEDVLRNAAAFRRRCTLARAYGRIESAISRGRMGGPRARTISRLGKKHNKDSLGPGECFIKKKKRLDAALARRGRFTVWNVEGAMITNERYLERLAERSNKKKLCKTTVFVRILSSS